MEQVEKFWQHNVEQLKWEGLVIRLNGDIWKVKPNCDIDVAIIGINKNNKGFEEGKAKSLKMALMNEEGNFVEIGDCSGIGEAESKELFELTKSFRVGEDSTTVFVQPVVIATVEYIQTYPDTRNKVYRIENEQIKETGETTLVRLRNPHVKGYRGDKKACLEDIGLNQVN
jgi:ATP-dependent DNA ligase